MIQAPSLKPNVGATIAVCLLVPLVISTATGSAGKSVGITSTFPTGARALAMGDAGCASSGGLGAMDYNPAVLSTLRDLEISGFYQRRLIDDSFSGIQLACPAQLGVLGLSLLHYTSGDIELLTTGGDLRVVVGQRDYIAGLRYAVRAGDHLGIGVGLKVHKSTLAEEFSAAGVGTEIGWLYESGEGRLSLGGSATNIGGHLKYKRQTEYIPWVIRLGSAYAVEVAGSPLQVTADFVKVREFDLREHIGMEAVIGECFAVRAGYRFGYESAGLTFGFGLQVGRLKLDHGIGVTDHFGDIHLTQITYAFF
jgi:hypothetical protein